MDTHDFQFPDLFSPEYDKSEVKKNFGNHGNEIWNVAFSQP